MSQLHFILYKFRFVLAKELADAILSISTLSFDCDLEWEWFSFEQAEKKFFNQIIFWPNFLLSEIFFGQICLFVESFCHKKSRVLESYMIYNHQYN